MISGNKIDILVAKFFSGEALPEEALELEDWLNMSPENKSYFDNCSRIFAMTVDITYHDRSRIWKNISDIICREETKPVSKVINWRLAGIAASAALIFAFGLLINNHTKKETGTIVYKAEASSKKILLKDNSEIIVLPNSSISINREYGANNRKIKLDGSAYFSVIHDPSREFIIDVNHLYIKDIGTRFNILSSQANDTILISVTQGEIAIYDNLGSSTNANAGEKWIYIISGKKLRLLEVKQIKDSSIKDTSVIPTRAAKEKAETKITDTVIKNKDQSRNIGNDSSGKYSYGIYPNPYPLDPGYTAGGRNARRIKDSTESKKITDDLIRDGLITEGQALTFTLSDTAFILNGKRQAGDVFQRYRQKYVPKGKGSEGWSWGHGAPAKQ